MTEADSTTLGTLDESTGTNIHWIWIFEHLFMAQKLERLWNLFILWTKTETVKEEEEELPVSTLDEDYDEEPLPMLAPAPVSQLKIKKWTRASSI